MATETYKKLAQGGLLAAGGIIYTAPATGAGAIVRLIHLVNVAGAQQSPKLWQGGVANSNLILPSTAMQAGEFANFDGVITLAPGDTLRGQCDSDNGVTYTISGVEIG